MKWYIKLIVFILIGLFIYLYISISDFTPKENELLIRINELELKIDSLNSRKDSIRTAIDSTHIKIITNEKHYKERINTIFVQPDSNIELFTRQYIFKYAASHGYHISGT